MKIKKIQAAELMNYNANTSGNRTTDCVKRSISLAFDAPYAEVAKMLNEEMKKRHESTWKIRSVYSRVILSLAGSASVDYEVVPEEDRVKLEEFVDTQVDPNVVYLVQTGSNRRRSNHLVCIRDGKVWDSWDSRDQYVISYYTIKGITSKQFTDIKDHLEEFGTYIIKDLVNNEIVKYAKKRGWDIGPIDIDIINRDYEIKAMAGLMLRPNELINVKRYYDINIPFVFSPTTSVDEAKELIQKVGKTKVYDRMWAVNEQEKKLAEEYEVKRQMKNAGDESHSLLFMDRKESKFFNSLPGWVKPLVTYLNIQAPGEYSDSYTLTIIPLPSDTRKHDRNRIEFEAYDASQLRDMIDRYKNKGEVPFEDYYPSEEY